jgi:hypothetical protein
LFFCSGVLFTCSVVVLATMVVVSFCKTVSFLLLVIKASSAPGLYFNFTVLFFAIIEDVLLFRAILLDVLLVVVDLGFFY